MDCLNTSTDGLIQKTILRFVKKDEKNDPDNKAMVPNFPRGGKSRHMAGVR